MNAEYASRERSGSILTMRARGHVLMHEQHGVAESATRHRDIEGERRVDRIGRAERDLG
ncbi:MULTISPECIES: hypothetical protein [unclassified Paraburkholderia]|uniref:hypothetical protein n=1 Tax=unclassified Paraburkholderia TaxID=2615204 RepID=UPI002AB04077|nr:MULTISPECIES: hypothetical protein [unclassified Paraburkholderia]